MENDLISRSALKAAVASMNNNLGGVQMLIDNAPAVDAVPRGVFEQVVWERNVAFEQLEEHGIPFGGTAPDVVEVVRCKDCIHWYEHEPVCLKIYSDGGVHPLAWQERNPDDFCSYGKRRKDNAAD